MPVTLRLRAERPGDLGRAAAILRAGGLVAFPTETVYGLGANALSPAAVRGIFVAKGRPGWDPLIVHLADVAELSRVTERAAGSDTRVDLLARAFWPGPLTLLLPRSPVIPDVVTAGRPRVGVRLPQHPIAQQLLHAVGLPLAAPSANHFGHISPTTAQHVLDDLDGRIDAVLDGGPTMVGLESTVLDPLADPMVIYRAGAVTADALREVTGAEVTYYVHGAESGAAPEALPSPGVGIRHYAPEARLVLSGPTLAALKTTVEAALAEASVGTSASIGSVGVLLPRNWQLTPQEELQIEPWGAWGDEGALAAELFSALRTLETHGVTMIVCPLPGAGGLGEALRDRLLKASRPR